MKRYIKAHAMSKSAIRDKIEDQTFPIMEAIAQLWLFPNADDVKHWRREVWSNLFRVPKLKGKHKLPDADFIYKSTWIEYEDSFETAVEAATEHAYTYEANSMRLQNLEQLKDLESEYFRWLAQKLSERRDVKPSEVYAKLEELGL